MATFLQFLDNQQLAYSVLCLSIFALFLAMAGQRVFKKQSITKTVSFLKNDYFFLGLIGLSIFIARLPILVYFSELNVDESLMLTEAITIREKFFFWKYIDPTTHGPFDIYPLILLSFGGAINYFTIRFTWLVCVIGIISFLYLTKKELFNQKIARLGIIPVVSFFCFYKYTDFTNYSSEHIPMLFLGLSVFILAKIFKNSELIHRQLFLVGLFLGTIPFAKLQAVPIALLIGLTTILVVLKKQHFSFQKATKPLLATILGSLTIPLICLAIIGLSNSFQEFWQMYFLDNFGYAVAEEQITLLGSLMTWINAYTGGASGIFLVLIGLIFIGFGLLFYKNGFSVKAHTSLLLFLLSFFAISLYCTIAPKRLYPHYLLFLIQPISFLVTFIFAEIYWSHKQVKWVSFITTTFIALLIIGFFAIGVGQQFGVINQSALLNKKLFGQLAVTYTSAQENPTTTFITENSSSKDPIVVWGYEPKIYVNSQRFSGTPYHFVSSLVGKHLSPESIDYHKKNFIQHFETSKPPVFIDATGKGNFRFENKEKYTFKHISPLAQIIENQYSFLSKSGNVDIYVRNEEDYSTIKNGKN